MLAHARKHLLIVMAQQSPQWLMFSYFYLKVLSSSGAAAQ
jgi:hypothetical protein